MQKKIVFILHSLKNDFLSVKLFNNLFYIILPVLVIIFFRFIFSNSYTTMIPWITIFCFFLMAIARAQTSLRRTFNIDISRKEFLLISWWVIVMVRLFIELIHFSFNCLLLIVIIWIFNINASQKYLNNIYLFTNGKLALFIVYLNFLFLYLLIFTISLGFIAYTRGSANGKIFSILFFTLTLSLIIFITIFFIYPISASGASSNNVHKFLTDTHRIMSFTLPFFNLITIFISIDHNWEPSLIFFMPTLYMLILWLIIFPFFALIYQKYQIGI